MNPRKTDFILWLDLETTGSDPTEDTIIEVGCILTRWDDLTSLSEFSMVAALPYPADVAELQMDPVVFDMHTQNGLLAEAAEASASIEEVESELLGWMSRMMVSSGVLPYNLSICLGGSGVSHFDSRFVRRDMPKLSGYLTYWSLDVGSVRRMFRRCNPDLMPALTPADKTHRALDDARMHLDEWRHYEELLRYGWRED